MLQARETREERWRAQLYQQIEEPILSDPVMVPLALIRYSLARRRRVRGFEINPLGFQYFHFRGGVVVSRLSPQISADLEVSVDPAVDDS